MDSKFKFTQARLNQLTCPEIKPRVLFQDEVRPELYFQVTQSGAKSYYCCSWNPAKGYTDKKAIGKFENVDLVDARKLAREIATLLAQGKDPAAKKKALKYEPTFAEAFESFIAEPVNRKKKGPRRESTVGDYKKRYRYHLASRFGSRRLSKFSHAEIDSLHTKIGEKNGIFAANRTVTLMSGIFNDAILKGWSGSNPAKGIEAFPESHRKRFLEEDEIGPFVRACEVERESGSRTIAEAILVALFTGVRRTNVCSASWNHIDLGRGKWNIPDEQMKNGEPHLVYLCDYLKKILVRRYQYRTNDEWVFPGVGKKGHLVEPKKGITRIVKRSRINPKGVHLHCMKHTFLTYADDLGLPSGVRKRLASHKGRGDVTDGYTHAREGRVREAYEKVAQHMLGFVKRT